MNENPQENPNENDQIDLKEIQAMLLGLQSKVEEILEKEDKKLDKGLPAASEESEKEEEATPGENQEVPYSSVPEKIESFPSLDDEDEDNVVVEAPSDPSVLSNDPFASYEQNEVKELEEEGKEDIAESSAEVQAEIEREEEINLEEEEKRRIEAEELARQEMEAEERALQEAADAERIRQEAEAEEQRRLNAEEEARRQEELALEEERARQEAEELARREMEAEERRRQEEMEAEELAQREEEERRRLEEEAEARRQAEERARQEAEQAQREAEERARQEAEAERMRKEAEEEARRQEEERARQEAEEEARRQAEERARQEAEQAQREEEERRRLEEEAEARRQAEERARQEAEQAQREAEELARREQEEASEETEVSDFPDLSDPSPTSESPSSPAFDIPLPQEDFSAPTSSEPYTPIYEQVDESTQTTATPSSSQNIEPVDILVSVAVRDPEAEETSRMTPELEEMRKDAKNEKKTKQKVKLEPLPFDGLVKDSPLIGTIFSPSGGVGKSSTAMNLAAYIAAIADAMSRKRGEKEGNVKTPRVLVLDGDIVQGSLAMRLTGRPEPSIHNLVLYLDEREEQGFSGEGRWPRHYENAPPGEKAMKDFVMWSKKIPNLNLLAAPSDPDYFYDFGVNEYKEIIRLLGKFYDVIIIDAGTEIVLESQRAWLAHAHEVFLMTAPEIDRLYNAWKATQYIAKSRPHPTNDDPNAEQLPPLVTQERLSVVMTRHDMDSGIDPENAVKKGFPWLEKEDMFMVPDFSAEMVRANNRGDFLVLENGAYAKVISQLAKHLFQRYAFLKQKGLGPASDQ